MCKLHAPELLVTERKSLIGIAALRHVGEDSAVGAEVRCEPCGNGDEGDRSDDDDLCVPEQTGDEGQGGRG